MPDEKEIFAARLNYYMELSGKTQIDIINDLGVNKSTISTWCMGKKMPRMGTIQTLADYFGVMKSDLIEEKPAIQEDDGLTDKQRKLLAIFDQLPDDAQKELYNFATFRLHELE